MGPADRRGNKWKDAVAAAPANAYVLPAGDYNDVKQMAEAVRKHPAVMRLTEGKVIFEGSGFWTDEKTGLQVRCRPDAFAPDSGIMGDLKTTGDASQWNWSRTAANMGYHVQEAVYTEGWQAAGGGDVNAFVFIVVETGSPHCTAVYELDPAAVVEGHAQYRLAIDKYKECVDSKNWPGYPDSVVPIDIPQFAYRETDSPQS
jgi:exodeoxyribonuclease VIII